MHSGFNGRKLFPYPHYAQSQSDLRKVPTIVLAGTTIPPHIHILLAIPDQLMGGHINVLLVGLDKAGRIKLMHCFSLHVPTPDQQPMDGHICIHLVGLDEAGRRIRLGTK